MSGSSCGTFSGPSSGTPECSASSQDRSTRRLARTSRARIRLPAPSSPSPWSLSSTSTSNCSSTTRPWARTGITPTTTSARHKLVLRSTTSKPPIASQYREEREVVCKAPPVTLTEGEIAGSRCRAFAIRPVFSVSSRRPRARSRRQGLPAIDWSPNGALVPVDLGERDAGVTIEYGVNPRALRRVRSPATRTPRRIMGLSLWSVYGVTEQARLAQERKDIA